MKKHYDLVYLTNTPSFYKVNLCNHIAEKKSLLLVLYGYGNEAVNTPLHTTDCKFDYVFLWEGDSAKRNKFTTFCKLCKLMFSLSYGKILYEGWYVPEYCLLSFFTPKAKNCILCESTIFESNISGIRGAIKKLIINRASTAMPSGTPHKEIFDSIKFGGEIRLTYGVGIFNKPQRGTNLKKPDNGQKRYLYVGRLIECKNLKFLIEQFNKNGKPLTIVGKGVLEDELKRSAKENITFEGFIENDKLQQIYSTHDIFILPSKTEPWGLVVEEAIYFGLPVIVSENVGCSVEMVIAPKTGVTFKLDDADSFDRALNRIESKYGLYRDNVENFDFDKRDKKQVEAYTSL